MTDGPLLSVEGLRTTFHTDRETVRAVDGVSFDVFPGQALGIVGESGSGKSVTARSILGLIDEPGRIDPTGSVRYHDPAFVRRIAERHPEGVRWVSSETDAPESRAGDGDESQGTAGSGRPTGRAEQSDDGFVTVTKGRSGGGAAEIDAGWVDLVAAPRTVVEQARGGEIAMVFQDATSSLNPVYTVGNQLRELLGIHRNVDGAEARETAAALLESVGISDPERRLNEYPHQFSGGMRQRVAIALALACDPEVLLCDEPTTGLDVTIQAQILELLERLQRERELAVVFITHDMGVVSEIADAVAVMYAGEVVERGSVHRLFSDPKHPYTRGLLESIPGLATTSEYLPTIAGSVPTPNEPATSCRFAPRCPEAMPECERVHPNHVAIDEGETSRPADATDDAGAARPPDAPPELGDADGSPRTAAHTAACLLYPEGVSHRRRLAAHGAAPEPNATESADAVDPDANERAKFTDDGEERS